MSTTRTRRPRRPSETPLTLRRAIARHREGDLPGAESLYRSVLDADADNADALNLLGVARTQSGFPDEGVRWIREALDHRPAEPDFLNNLGLALVQAGRHEEACAPLEQAARGRPRFAQAWLNLGVARHHLGLHDDACEAYRRYILLDGSQADAHFNLGCILLEEDDLEGAEAAFRADLDRRPAHAEGLNNLGVVLLRRGDLGEAEKALRAAVAAAPDHVGAQQNLGVVLSRRGDAAGALDTLWAAVRHDPTDPVAWSAFAGAFQHVEFGDAADTAQLLDVLLACLARDGLDHPELARQAVAIFRRDPALEALFAAEAEGDAALAAAVRTDGARAALDRPVFRLALERTVLPDLALERILRALRRAVLEEVASGTSRASPGLVCSLARQCFHNGYVWRYDDAEVGAVEGMVRAMDDRPLGDDPLDLARVATLGCYVRLLEWERAEEVMELAGALERPELAALVRQQIIEPYQELVYAEAIPELGRISDPVSEAVRAQYEEHPYPRWISATERRPDTVAGVLREVLPGVEIPGTGAWDRPRILVAGCGTGKHLVDTAQRFRDADIVAIDLSRASLAYALRKAAEAGLGDLRLLQADILELGGWDQTFDLIECGGVLHHMGDPVEGWRVLCGRLRPGGLMHVGLYSERARAEVVEARELIAQEGFASTDEGIREARPIIAERILRPDGVVRRFRDFYSMEECRDLLFHVQEHRFTLPRLAEVLAELGLDFLGFELTNPTALPRFHARFPEAGAARDLAKWDRFEEENPTLFAGMYQFWVRKPEA